MINLKDAKKQSDNVKKLMTEMNKQNAIFEKTIDSVMKGAPESDKMKISQFGLLVKKAISLAKQGKGDEAQQLIKNFKHGGQSN